MLLQKIKVTTSVLLVAVVLGGLPFLWSGWMSGGQAKAQEDRKPAQEQQAGLPPFNLTVGKHYQILLPNHKQWPGEQQLVLVQKNFSNGWVEVKTEENQTAWINLRQAMQVYLIADPQKYHREAARQP